MKHGNRPLASIPLIAFATAAVGMPMLGGGGFSIDWYTMDGGGGTSADGTFELSGTIGQPDAGVMSGGTFILSGGFWVFGEASPPCPWDCGGDDDGIVGIVDFLALLAQWGGPGSCDSDGGGVGITDFLELLANWGPCP